MEPLIWFHRDMKQVDKLVFDNIIKLPTAFYTIDELIMDENKEYHLALMYHQTLSF